MIILDENVHQQSIMASIAAWYRGQVLSITMLGPNTLIKDEAVPGHCLRVPFLTGIEFDDVRQRWTTLRNMSRVS
jgi:hypothetical protein